MKIISPFIFFRPLYYSDIFYFMLTIDLFILPKNFRDFPRILSPRRFNILTFRFYNCHFTRKYIEEDYFPITFGSDLSCDKMLNF